MPVLYSDKGSGNCYKARLIMTLVGQPFEVRETTVSAGQTRTPEFLAVNPVGKVPVLVLDDGRVLTESNAMLMYFGEGTAMVPADRFARAQMAQWMFWEQYSHETAIAVARYLMRFQGGTEATEARLPGLWAKGNEALGLMDRHLADRDFFVDGGFSLADIALYAYTHVAGEGGFDLGPYANVRAWLDRVAARPGHRSMAEI